MAGECYHDYDMKQRHGTRKGHIGFLPHAAGTDIQGTFIIAPSIIAALLFSNHYICTFGQCIWCLAVAICSN